MRFEELGRKLPNGFHDAKMHGFSVDLVDRVIVLDMDLHVGSPGDPDPELRRRATLKVLSLCVFFIEPPDPTYTFVPDGSPVNVSGDAIAPGQSPALDRLLPELPNKPTVFRFFIEEWNSFLYLGGAEVEFFWRGP